MAEQTKISWTDHTFNIVHGCTRVSPGCLNCYADTLSRRWGKELWGKDAPRQIMSDTYWKLPLKWERQAAATGTRPRVFCGSMCDWAEAHETTRSQVPRLWELIRATPHLDWLLLTKRPEEIRTILPQDWGNGYPNVWLGTSVEDQKRADLRIPELISIPAVVRFLSCEPLLGPLQIEPWIRNSKHIHMCVDISGALKNKWFNCFIDDDGRRMRPRDVREKLEYMLAMGQQVMPMGEPCEGFDPIDGCPGHPTPRIDWVICGGESGPHFRPMDLQWAQDLHDQCTAAQVPFWFKQTSGRQSGLNEDALGNRVQELPETTIHHKATEAQSHEN